MILTVALAVYFLFRAALGLGPILGKTTTLIVNRDMGLIVASISIEFIVDGIAQHFPELTTLH